MKLLRKFLAPFKQLMPFMPIRLRTKIRNGFNRTGDMSLGNGVFIHPSVHILGENFIKIESNSCISEGTWLNANNHIRIHDEIVIGQNCFIGKRNFFTSGLKISIGSFSMTAVDAKFIGSGHRFEDPLIPYIFSGTTCSDSIRVGVNCFFGAGSSVVGNVSVGYGSVVAAQAVVLSDVPPFSIVVGSPAKVIKRFSFASNSWIQANEFSQVDEMSIPTEERYFIALTEKYGDIELPWVAAGRNMGNL